MHRCEKGAMQIWKNVGYAKMHHGLEVSVKIQRGAQEVLHMWERTQRMALVGEGAGMA